MKMEEVKSSILKKAFPNKDPWLYKGQYGRLLVIGGSYTMTGAPLMVGMSAARVGTDLIFLAGPKRAMDVAATYHPSFITLPIDGNVLLESSLQEIFEFAKESHITALAIGPGLGTDKRTFRAVVKIIDGFEVPIVADADALRALGDVGRVRVLLKDKNIILTPHAEEFYEMTGDKAPKELDQRAAVVRDNAKKMSATIILKGRVDIISDGENVAVNKTGNVFMTKGGFGDTLTGICASFLARRINKLDTFTAACAAAYINGRAGDIAAEKIREGLMINEMLDAIPEVIRRA